jgi:3',5'-cyclic AMP phosphodiesterase CpdA
MPEAPPFEFKKARHVVERTDLKARDLSELRHGILLAWEDSLFFHMHRLFLFQPTVEPAYPNDFSLWAAQFIGNLAVAERFAGVNPLSFSTLGEMRHELARILAEFLTTGPVLRRAPPGFEFAFRWTRSVVLPTRYRARDLAELADGLERTEAASLYWHLFDGRRRLGGRENDFSAWLRPAGHAELAERVGALDVYTLSLDERRARLAGLVRKRMVEERTRDERWPG